jgi:hypothetical protein
MKTNREFALKISFSLCPSGSPHTSASPTCCHHQNSAYESTLSPFAQGFPSHATTNLSDALCLITNDKSRVELTPTQNLIDMAQNDNSDQEPDEPASQQEVQSEWPCANPTCAYGIESEPAMVRNENETCRQCVGDLQAHQEASKSVPGPCQEPGCPHGGWHDGNSSGICDDCWMDMYDKAAEEVGVSLDQGREDDAVEDVEMTNNSGQH